MLYCYNIGGRETRKWGKNVKKTLEKIYNTKNAKIRREKIVCKNSLKNWFRDTCSLGEIKYRLNKEQMF